MNIANDKFGKFKVFFFIDFCRASDLIFREKFEILLEISEGYIFLVLSITFFRKLSIITDLVCYNFEQCFEKLN